MTKKSTIKWLIVGRTATGKDTLRAALEKKGMTFVKSWTTREKRFPEEDTHIFVTHETADNIPASEKAAVTHINNGKGRDDEYFATKQDVMSNDAYIIDPAGVKMLFDTMPDTQFGIIYLYPDKEEQKKHAVERVAAENREAELKKFEKRYASENAEFTEFEKWIEEETRLDNLIRYSHIILKIRNNYKPDFFDVQAGRIIGLSRMHQRLTDIVDECMNIGIVMKGDSGKAAIAHNEGILQMRPEEYASILMGDSDSFTTVMQSWLIESPWISYR